MDAPYGFKPGFEPTAPHSPCPNCSASLSYPTGCSCKPHHSIYPVLSQPEAPYPYQSPYSSNQPPSISPSPPSAPTTHHSVPLHHSYHASYPVGRTAYRWVDTTTCGGVPSTAVHGGVDIDGHTIYVGRAFYEGDWIPAKVIPGKHAAYVAYGGQEILVHHFQILCEQRFEWVPAFGGHVPPDAVQGGNTSDGEPLFIGRAYHEGSQTIGKVHPTHGCCYIPFDGKEIRYDNYEVLVLRC